MVGSTEWVEDYAPWLAKTAISYLNIDVAVSGPSPGLDGSPELSKLAVEVMKKVTYPYGGNSTLFDVWEVKNRFNPEMYRVGVLGSGSDFTAFVHNGVGAVRHKSQSWTVSSADLIKQG